MPYKDPEVARAKSLEVNRKRRQRMRDERNEQRRAALASRATDPVECALAAGWFEEEGTATIVRSSQGGRYPDRDYSRCLVTLTSTDREIIDWLQERWPGSVSTKLPDNERHSRWWIWRLNGDAILPFLVDIKPFLLTARKRRVVELVMMCQMARWNGQRGDGYRDRIAAYHEQVRALNRRGR